MSKLFASILNRFFALARRGSSMIEYAIILGLVSIVSIGAILALSQKTDTSLCQSANGLGQGTGNYHEHCEGKGFGESEKKGFDRKGFVDLHLNISEITTRRVILPVKNFDVKGLDEILTSTDRPDSVAACYEIDNSQVTCASMRGTDSAFSFPPGVTGVGYEILPLQDDRDAMAQPVSITLGSIDNPQNNKTWNILVYREAVPNVFAPNIAFEDLKLPAGTIGEYTLIKELKGEFDRDDLEFSITPTEGEFAICSQDKQASETKCGLSQAEMSWLTVPTDTHGLGYQMHLPFDVRTPVSWPLTIKLASIYNPDVDFVSWDIVVSRVSTEAPAFHTLNFSDVEFAPDATGIHYTMVDLDPDYPSDLMVKAPQGEQGLAFCFKETADGEFDCSPDVSVQDVALTVPAGAHSMGYATVLPEDVLNAFTRQIEFEVMSVDYPDFVENISVRNHRPEFTPVFEPTVVFEDKAFPEGAVGDQVELVALTGNFNSDLDMVIAAPQPGSQVCVRLAADETNPDGDVVCSGAADEREMQLVVPLGASEIGYSVNLGESAFQPVDKTIQFELRDSKDPSLKQAYSVRVTRPAKDVVFEPNMAAMTIDPVSYPEMATGWQQPQMTPVAGNFNSDLLLTTPAGVDYSEPCYQAIAGSDPVCGQPGPAGSAAPASTSQGNPMTAMQSSPGKTLRVPLGSYAIGVRPFLSEDIHVEQDLTLNMTLGSAETAAFAEAISASAYRPAVPVKFDPNLGFRDKIFEVGLSGEQFVMVPIEGEITTGLTMNAPQTIYPLRMCYVDVAGSRPICSTDAQFGDVSFDVPQNSLSVGYRVDLPMDIHVDWGHAVAFKVTSSYDESLDYDVNVNASRESNVAAYAPTTEFAEMVFESGTSGAQLVIEPIAGNVNTQGQVVMPVSGLPVHPCYQKTASADPVCTTKDTQDAQQIGHPDWPGVQPGEIKPRMYAAGYKVVLPEDVHTAVDWTFNLRLESTYDDTLGRDYTVRVVREALPVTWEPDASMKLPDADFAVKSTGAQDTIIPFKGNFTTKTDYVISGTKQPVHPCYRQSSTGDIVCGDSAAGVGAQITLDPDWEFIGYRVILPSDLAEEVEETVNVTLRSAYDPSLYVGQTFRIYREPAPVVFSPTVSFSDHTFTKAETGWQRVMEPLTGNMTTDLELTAAPSDRILLCVQDVAGGDTRCTSEGSANADKTIDVAPNAHAIGYAVKLPDDPYVNDTQTISFDLRMKDYPSQRRSYTVTTNRPKPDVTFSTNMVFGSANFPEGMTGWFNFMKPLAGSFSSDIELVAENPGVDLKLCTQATSSSEVVCQPSDNKMLVDKSHYAIGYALEFGEDVFAAWQRTSSLTLRSKPYPSVKKDWNPTVKRAARNVELPPSNLFVAQTYEEGEFGERMIMAALNGAGNSDMVYEVSATDFDVRLCIQETEVSAVSCQASSAQAGGQSYDITPDTFKIGYRISLPTDKFDTYDNRLRLAIKSKAVETQVRNYNVRLFRPVQKPVMPAQDLFGDVSYPAQTTGEKTIMAPLDPKIDTQLSMTKNSNQSDVGVCYQQSQSGAVVCEGLDSTQSATIVDENRSWYAAGYRVKLPESDWADVSKTINFELASEEVPSERRLYRPRLVRPALETIMPGAGFFSDQQYPAGKTGLALVMVDLDPATNTQLKLWKASGQNDVELCFKTSASSPVTCEGAGLSSYEILDTANNWHAIGYRFYLDDDTEKEIVRTISLTFKSADVPADTHSYAVEITRMRLNATMPDRTFFSDQVVSEGTEGDVKFMELLGDDTNISLKLHKAAGQPDVAICYQQSAGSNVECLGKGDTGEVSKIIELGWRSIGYQVDVGTKFDGVDRQVELHLTARDGQSNRVDYDVRVSKTGTQMVMPEANMFGNETYPQGETGKKIVLASFKPGINTGLQMVKSAGQPGLELCRRQYEASQLICQGAGTESEFIFTVDAKDFQVGYRIDLGNSEFKDHNQTHTFRFESTDVENQVVSYAVTTTRPKTPIVMPGPDFFADITVPEGTKSYKIFKTAMNGQFNTNMTLKIPAQGAIANACVWQFEASNPACDQFATDKDSVRSVSSNAHSMGFNLYFPTNEFEKVDYILNFTVSSDEDPSVSQDYAIRIHRPHKVATLPPAGFFQDAVFAEGETGLRYAMTDLGDTINATVKMTIPQNGLSTMPCYTGQAGQTPYCGRSGTSASQDVSVNLSQVHLTAGIGVYLPTNVYESFDESINFTLTSSEDATVTQDYSVRVQRPAKEATMPPATLFQDVTFPVGTSGFKDVLMDVTGMMNTQVDFTIPAQGFNAVHAFATTGATAYGKNAESVEATQRLNGPILTKLGYRILLPDNDFVEYDETLEFTLTSTEDPAKTVSYVVRIQRPAKDVTMPPATLFQDVTFPVGTSGYKDVLMDVTGVMNTQVDFTIPAQGFSVVHAFATTGATSYGKNAESVEATHSLNGPTLTKLGYRILLPGNDFEAYDETLEFTLTSTEDSTKTVSYVVRIQRPAKEVTMPPADYFQDVTLPEGATRTQYVLKDVAGAINAHVDLIIPQNGIISQACLESGGSKFCSSNTSQSADSVQRVATTHDKMGFAVYVGTDEYKAYDETINFRIVSTQDATVFRDYSVRVQRPGREVTMPSSTLFKDVVFPAGTTGQQQVMENVAGQINTRFIFDMPQQGFDVSALASNSPTNTPGNYGSAKDAAVSRELDGPSTMRVGYQVSLPSDEFVAFNETLEFSFTSVSDPTKKVSYIVNISRPAQEITMPSETLYQDVSYVAGVTGDQDVLRDVSNSFNADYTLNMPVQNFPVSVIGQGFSGSRKYNYGSAMSTPVSRDFGSNAARTLGYRVTLPSDTSIAFNETLEFEFVSKIDPTRKVTYIVNISRPAR